MAVLQIYDQLLQFPLFQGMSRDDLEIVAGHTRFGFSKLSSGKKIVVDGEPCTQLYFLRDGSVTVETFAEDHRFSVVERMSAPFILQQEAIFGYHQCYTHTYTSLTKVNMLTIDKEEVLRLLEEFLIFRLNMVNLFATQTQKLFRRAWQRSPQSLRERACRFFLEHSTYPAGHKTFYILMGQLAEELNDSRLNVSRLLKELEQEELVESHRGRVEIPQLERLIM